MITFLQGPTLEAGGPAGFEPDGLPADMPALTRKLIASRMSRWQEPWRSGFARQCGLRPSPIHSLRAICALQRRPFLLPSTPAPRSACSAIMMPTAPHQSGSWPAISPIWASRRISASPTASPKATDPISRGLTELVDKGCSLIVILDSGSTAFGVMEEAHVQGIKAVIIDHHACAADQMPRALAFVIPIAPTTPAALAISARQDCRS